MPNLFPYAIAAILAIAVVFVAAMRVHLWWTSLPRAKRSIDSVEDRVRKERELAVRRAVEAGTHLPNGSIRCTVGKADSQCSYAATHPRLTFSRSTGLFAWFRERLGAPVRLSIEATDPDHPAYCESHYHLSVSEMAVELNKAESERLRLTRDQEIDLGDFERRRLAIRLSEMHEKQAKLRPKKAETNVVPIRKAGT